MREDLVERLRIAAKILRDMGGQSAMADTVDEAAAALAAQQEAAAMTDIELLPLPIIGEGFNAADIRELMTDYARAVAEHNVKERDAMLNRYHDECALANLRAERLEEALRDARQMIRDLLPDATFTKWDALLRDHDQEVGDD